MRFVECNRTINEYSSVHFDNIMSMSFLDLEQVNSHVFRSKTILKLASARGIYGGTMIGQALMAASQCVPEGQQVHSLHSYFLKGGRDDIPVMYYVDKIRDGKTYCTRSVKAVQSGNAMFTLQASFKQNESTSADHQLLMPKVPHPDQLETITEVLDRLHDQKCVSESDYTFGKEWYDAFPATTKLVEPEQLLFQKSCYPKRHLWIKAKGHFGEDQNENMHKCYLAYFSDSFILQTALLHLAPFSSTTSIFHTSLDHSMWFHVPCRADQWLLCRLETEYIGDGRALCRSNIWDTSGNMVISAVQEGVMRHSKAVSKF